MRKHRQIYLISELINKDLERERERGAPYCSGAFGDGNCESVKDETVKDHTIGIG